MTPLEEFLSLIHPPSRTDLIKQAWIEIIDTLPESALQQIIDADDCNIVECESDELGVVMFQKITYGGKQVIEADGVVVCRLL